MHTGLAALLAHQGGWDEILRIAGPIAVVGFTISFLNRRMTAVDAIDDAVADRRETTDAFGREEGASAVETDEAASPQAESAQRSKAGTGPALSQSAKNAPRS